MASSRFLEFRPLFYLALLGGLALRLAEIGRSLWLDEFSTLWAVEARFADVLSRVPTVMGQSPFYYVVAWFTVHTFGESEWALRVPSLIAVILATLAVYECADAVGGRRAAGWAAALFWLSYFPTWESIDARPYALAFLAAALALNGFARAVLTGSGSARVVWILGAAMLVWTHYLFLPYLAAHAIAYAAIRSLRTRYGPRAFAADVAIIALIVSPAMPQFFRMLAHTETQGWIFQGRPLGVLAVAAPFLLAAVFPAPRRTSSPAGASLERLMWILIVAQVAALFVGTMLGPSLLSPRYASVIVVPAALLAGLKLGRLGGADLIVPLTLYAATTALTMLANLQVCGSFSGAGCQEWRQAVAAVAKAKRDAPDAPVLFRSGNAEDDLSPPGHLGWPATLAPLRSPHTVSPDWPIVLLTYRWNSESRRTYFENTLHPLLARQQTFFLLCLVSNEPGSHGYCDDTVAWIDRTMLGRYQLEPLGRYRQLQAIRFSRRSDESR